MSAPEEEDVKIPRIVRPRCLFTVTVYPGDAVGWQPAHNDVLAVGGFGKSEKCPRTGRIHWHCVTNLRIPTVDRKKVWASFAAPVGSHLEVVRSSVEALKHYCRKSLDWATCDKAKGDRCEDCEKQSKSPYLEWDAAQPFLEWGVQDYRDPNPGQRVDLEKARALIVAKKREEDLIADPELDNVIARFPKWVERVFNASQAQRDGKLSAADPDIKVIIDRPYDWQTDLLAKLKMPPKRREIFWIWSDGHGVGKSTTKEWLLHAGLSVLPVISTTPFQDVIRHYSHHDVIFCNLVNMDESANLGFYNRLETLSDKGYHLATKYEGGLKYLHAHVVVAANQLPRRKETCRPGTLCPTPCSNDDCVMLPQRFVYIEAKKN